MPACGRPDHAEPYHDGAGRAVQLVHPKLLLELSAQTLHDHAEPDDDDDHADNADGPPSVAVLHQLRGRAGLLLVLGLLEVPAMKLNVVTAKNA